MRLQYLPELEALSSIMIFRPFEPYVLWNLAVLLVLLAVSALVSGSETAFFSLSPADIRKVRSWESRSGKAVLSLLSDQNYLLATILIINNLVNICIVILSNRIIDSLVTFGSTAWEFGIKTILVTFLLLLFGEIMPKISANYNPLGFARTVAVPLRWTRSLLKPLSWLLVKLGGSLGNGQRSGGNISIDELSDALEMTASQNQPQKEMLSEIVTFASTEVTDIMRPRPDITGIEVESDFDEVKRVILDSGFSRIPAYRESMDNIEGILYVKDIIPFISESDGFDWRKHLRKAYYVPEHKKIHDLLEEFRKNKVHLAIVVDEYGSTLGLVSLEDIVEEIVGEITDESDTDHVKYTKISDGVYLFEGTTTLWDFERVAGLDEGIFDDVKGEAETIAGLMLEVRGDFLKKGESLTTHGIRFTVDSLDGRRIGTIKVELPAELRS